MLIVLEGPDGGGKSTLATALAERFAQEPGTQSRVIHTGPPSDPSRCPFDEYEVALNDLMPEILSPDHLVVLDRWHAGDPIYGPRYRGFSRLTPEGSMHVEMTLRSLGAVRVMCLPNLDTVTERVRRDGDWYIDPADLPRIHAEYFRYGRRYRWRFAGNDADDRDGWSDFTVKHLLASARRRRIMAGRIADLTAGTYTGSPWPLVIFVGDQVGASAQTRPEITRPFTPITRGGCSNHLLRALMMAGDDIVNRCGLVNAYHPGVDLTGLAALPHGAHWVALGVNAAKALADAGIDHDRAPHPQFAWRFRSYDVDGYAAELVHAARLS